jgi:integrase
MRTSYRDPAPAASRSKRGTGSLRERSPGVWEVRVVIGFDPARARSIQCSFTVHGDAALAGKARRELVAEYGSTRVGIRHAAPAVTVGELLERYLASAQFWKPATIASHRHVVSTLVGDPLCRCRLQSLAPAVMRAAICSWRHEGVSVAKVSARWLLLRAAVSWAVAEGLLALNPLAGMRGPPRPQPRRHHSQDEVRRLLAATGDAVTSAQDAFRRRPGSAACARRLFAAEQPLLLVRLTADCGARRGELAVLRLSDLDGRVLTIERSLSAGVLGPTKSGRTRRVTLGSGTTDMIQRHFQAWAAREEPEEDWLFSPSPRRPAHMTAGAPSRRLTRLWPASGVEHAALHRLRHGVATYLVDQGLLLKAQARLGHRDPATTSNRSSDMSVTVRADPGWPQQPADCALCVSALQRRPVLGDGRLQFVYGMRACAGERCIPCH